MVDNNKVNLLFFESTSMKGLYEAMTQWQVANEKRLLSTNIQKDGGVFCCIALTNPTEVVICEGNGPRQAHLDGGLLKVMNCKP